MTPTGTNGTTLGGRYTLTERIAAGGMGEVWAGTDNVLGRTIAVKLLHPALSRESDFTERFRAEARHAASLHHPNIAVVFDYGEDDGTAYLVMELVVGQPLSQIIAERAPLPAPETAAILVQAATALEAAHQGGVIHRDVKPANILITPAGTAKLTDFGISRATTTAPLTQTGQVLGTAQYLSPEQALGQSATAASDIYSLGVVGYEMLTGERPFDHDTVVATALAHVNQPPKPLPATVPHGIRDVIDAAMAKGPADRPSSAAAVAHALGTPGAALTSEADSAQAALPSAPPSAPPSEPTQALPSLTRVLPAQATSANPVGRSHRRPRGRLLAATAGAAVLAVLTVLALTAGNGDTRTPPPAQGTSATQDPTTRPTTRPTASATTKPSAVVAPPVTSSVPVNPATGQGNGKKKGKQ